MVVLGIDPGTRVAGYVIFKKEGGRVQVLDYGLLKMPATTPLPDRVHHFFTFFDEKITTFSVTAFALETPFLGKNASNFLKLGYMRGALYILASQHRLALYEYAPTEIKRAVTGFGGADKDQVARVVHRLFPGLAASESYDLTDAFGIGLCAVWALRAV